MGLVKTVYPLKTNKLYDLFNSFGLSCQKFPYKSYLSGSSVLNLYNNESNFSDLDIYIELNVKDSLRKNIILLNYLFKSKYIASDKEFIACYSKLAYCYHKNNNNEYIKNVITLQNDDKQKIDLIFINCNIGKLLSKTFDLDIVKNHIQIPENNNYIVMFNKKAVDEKKATIKFKFFRNYIINNEYRYHSFIVRYNKYTMRGYQINIGYIKISNNILQFMNYIILKYKFKVTEKEFINEIKLNNHINQKYKYNNQKYKYN